MKKFLSLFLIVCAMAINANAQDYLKPSLSYAIHPGTVTTLEGQVIQGYIDNSDNVSNQNRCIFYIDYKDRRSMKKYGPADIAGYSVENNQYKSINYSGSLKLGKAGKNFVYVSKPGAITTYIYWVPDEEVLWAKGNEEPVGTASLVLGFRKNMLKLIADHTELAGKVERKEKGFGPLNVLDIINEYNVWAESKKP